MNKAHMNHGSFLEFIEKDRGCEAERLDRAVRDGLRRAKAQSGRLDSGRLFMLAAACVFTVVMCFTVNIRLFKTASEQYYENRQKVMPDAGAALGSYAKTLAEKFESIAETGFRKTTTTWR